MPDQDEQKSNPPQEPLSGAKSALDRLEQHTARLMEDQRKESDGGSSRSRTSFGPRRFTLMGVEFLGVILIFALIGHWLDGKFGWPGYATVTCIILAVIGELYLQIKLLLGSEKK